MELGEGTKLDLVILFQIKFSYKSMYHVQCPLTLHTVHLYACRSILIDGLCLQRGISYNGGEYVVPKKYQVERCADVRSAYSNVFTTRDNYTKCFLQCMQHCSDHLNLLWLAVTLSDDIVVAGQVEENQLN
jgi:hypothetical protein